MTAVIFIGPTISKSDALAVVDAICLPPAAQGDVYRAMRHNPTHIGIIDGYFDGVAAVWHKEILWAMSKGVQVFGASSMGALRASELADFGMIGVGEIFDGFYNGRFEDDDEVAVTHGPAEIGYPALCEPMVNIRATLKRAVDDKIIAQHNADIAAQTAKYTHYRHRTWKALIVETDLGGAFAEWLKTGKINQKHLDAVAMLQALKTSMIEGKAISYPTIPFVFEWTNQWVRAKQQWDLEPDSELLENNSVLDELRLLPDAFAVARDAAMLRFSTINGSPNAGYEVSKPVVTEKINSLRMERGLLSGAQFNQWLADNELTTPELEQLLAEEVLVKESIDLTSLEFQHYILGHLKLTGGFYDLSARAKAKRASLIEMGISSVSAVDARISKPVLLDWYFGRQQNVSIPQSLEAYSANLGLPSREDFYQLLAREYLYLQSNGNTE